MISSSEFNGKGTIILIDIVFLDLSMVQECTMWYLLSDLIRYIMKQEDYLMLPYLDDYILITEHKDAKDALSTH